jgi:hypothetical protein
MLMHGTRPGLPEVHLATKMALVANVGGLGDVMTSFGKGDGKSLSLLELSILKKICESIGIYDSFMHFLEMSVNKFLMSCFILKFS